TRSVGSFFINPVLDRGRFAAVERAARAVAGPGARVPCYPAGDGRVKVPAAWLIERAGFGKGYPAVGEAASGTRAPSSSQAPRAPYHPRRRRRREPAGAGGGGRGGRPRDVRGGAGERAGAGGHRALSGARRSRSSRPATKPRRSAAVHALDLAHRDAEGRSW